MRLTAIISGGQTGADRGGLDAAIALGLNHGGYVPKGRGAEDGRVPDKYTNMVECEGDGYPERTRRNVELADATAIFFRGEIGRGSMLTAGIAGEFRRPNSFFDLEKVKPEALLEFVVRRDIAVLNVAGTRESRAPGIQWDVCKFILEALA